MMPSLAAWLHNLDPYALQLWEGGPIRWYGLSYLAGFAMGFYLLKHIARAGVSTLKPEHVGDFVVSIAIGIVVGGRLGYVLFYRPELLGTFTDRLPYWGVLAINEGGMASHGGMIGGTLACLYYAYRHKHNRLFLFDLLAFGAPLGLAFGRLANFINGELVGRPCAETFPLAVKFPQAMFDWTYERQLEVLAPLYGSFSPQEAPGVVASAVQQIQLNTPSVVAHLEPLLTPRHPSQLYAALLEGVLVFALLAFIWRIPRKPGLIAGVFCIAYGIVRIANEFFRMPDAHLIADGALPTITRGQWLSAALIAVGITTVLIARKAPGAPAGGWLGQPGEDETADKRG